MFITYGYRPFSWILERVIGNYKVLLFLRLPNSIKALLVTSDRKPSKARLRSYLMKFIGAFHQQVNQSTSRIRESAPGTRAFSYRSGTWDHNTVISFFFYSSHLCLTLFLFICWLNYFLLQKSFLHVALNVAPVSLHLAQKKKSFLFPNVLVSIQGKDPNCSCFN